MSISGRILVASSFINEGDIIADIGCDHGYLGIEALKRGAKRVDYIDNKEGPLSKARLNSQELCDGKNINYYLSNGLDRLNSDVNKIFILGMGGELIVDIIEKDIDKIQNNQILILDAHLHIDILRQFLFDNYFLIKEEIILKEKNVYYEIIIAQKSDKLYQYNELDLMFGPILRIKKDPLFIEKWTNILNKYQEIKEKNQINDLDDKIERIKSVL